jgi:hypothetical protein
VSVEPTRSRWYEARGPSAPEESAWGGDTPSWLASLAFHLGVLALMAVIGVVARPAIETIAMTASTAVPEDLLTTSQDFRFSDDPAAAIGSAAPGEGDIALAAAPTLGLSATLPSQLETMLDPSAAASERIAIQEEIRVATGPRFSENLAIKGSAGVGATGTGGVIDRITQEILLSLEERNTLVVWLFDQSGSLAPQRADILRKLDRIYEELGVVEASGNPAFKRAESKPLLTSVVAFGQSVTFLTPKPTDSLDEIKAALAGMKTDDSGVEKAFTAVRDAAERYRSLRTSEPRRNVMIVVFTDEAGDDEDELDRAVAICRRAEIPVFAVGVPAPFGRRDALVKYVDPDPKFDQTPQWVPVRQGPESYQSELVNLASTDDEPMDSGFGPYSLTRLCYETGGIFFAIHPNRSENKNVSRRETAQFSAQLNHFFDPHVMQAYRPDYVSIKEYQRLLTENKARAALVQAAQMSWITPMERPDLVFPKTSDADLANRLTRAQRTAAVVGPKIATIYEILRQGEKDRARLTKRRWQAGYDLSMGRVLAVMVRADGYNAILAKAKQGMRFTDPKNDTWRLVPTDQVTVSSTLEKQAAAARQYLERVVAEHPQTPWALLAEKELKQPLGWKWEEMFTGVNAPRQVAGNNNAPRRPQDDKARMLPRPEKRPAPKL